MALNSEEQKRLLENQVKFDKRMMKIVIILIILQIINIMFSLYCDYS